MPARLLYLGVVPEDFEILQRRVRPAPNTEVRLVHLGGGSAEGIFAAVEALGDYRADAVIYSPHIGDPAEQEAIFAAVLRE